MSKKKLTKLQKETEEFPKFIVDCNNVVYIDNKKIDMDRLYKILKEIEIYGKYLVIYSGRLHREISKTFFKEYPDLDAQDFCAVPNGEDADLYILEAAKKLGSRIVSLDHFKEYRKMYPEATKRRIPFVFVNLKSGAIPLIPQLNKISK